MSVFARAPRPRGRRHRAVVASAVALCVALAAAILFIPFLPFFCLYDIDAPGHVFIPGSINPSMIFASFRIAATGAVPETDFVISYTHSVNKSRVRDYYRFDGDRVLRVVKTRFVSWGAGIPDPDFGNTLVIADDYIEIGNIDRIIPRLVVRVGVIADHALETSGSVYRLSDIFRPQTAVAFEYRNLSVYDYMRSLHQQKEFLP